VKRCSTKWCSNPTFREWRRHEDIDRETTPTANEHRRKRLSTVGVNDFSNSGRAVIDRKKVLSETVLNEVVLEFDDRESATARM
jgi:hypothetical protein